MAALLIALLRSCGLELHSRTHVGALSNPTELSQEQMAYFLVKNKRRGTEDNTHSILVIHDLEVFIRRSAKKKRAMYVTLITLQDAHHNINRAI